MTLDTLRESIKNELVLQTGNVFAGRWHALNLVQIAAGLGISGPDFLALINTENQALAPNLSCINILKTAIEHQAKGRQNTLTDVQRIEFINKAGLLDLPRSFVMQEWIPIILAGLPSQTPTEPKPSPKPVFHLNWRILILAFVGGGLFLFLVWFVYKKPNKFVRQPEPITLIKSLPPVISPLPPKSAPQTPTSRKTIAITGGKRKDKPIRRFDEIGTDRHESGLRPARKNQQWGYINANSELIIRPRYKYARPFRKGRAHVFDADCGWWLFIDEGGQQQP